MALLAMMGGVLVVYHPDTICTALERGSVSVGRSTAPALGAGAMFACCCSA
jgi:hypothetical protein